MNKLTLNSKIGELYQTPIGHDALAKVLLQLGISEKVLINPIVSNLKLKTIATLTKKQLGPTFFESLINLINIEKDVPFVSKGEITKKWWIFFKFILNCCHCFFSK